MTTSTTDSTPLRGRTAVVTGASSGIGRAIAERLGAAGAHVYLSGRTLESMEQAVKRIEAAGGRGTAVVMDMRDVAQVRDLVARAARETGRLDVMVNNAGVSFPAPILDGDAEEWRAMLETNILGLLVGSQAAVKAMRACKAQGHVVNISSIAAQRSDPGVYGATKHAVNALSATLRRELEDDTIRVVNVMPGAISTNFARNFDPAFVKQFVAASGVEVDVKKGEKLPDAALDGIPDALRNLLGRPEDVAEAVLFAVTQPITVNIADIVVRPPKSLNLP
jgi:NADP-dependent 3-hydroxy acid dehydrogenase YdfG